MMSTDRWLESAADVLSYMLQAEHQLSVDRSLLAATLAGRRASLSHSIGLPLTEAQMLLGVDELRDLARHMAAASARRTQVA